MVHITGATFEDGVFKPDVKLDLASGTKVRLVVTARDDDAQPDEPDRLRDEEPIDSSGLHLTRDELHDRNRSDSLYAQWADTLERRRRALKDLERLRSQRPIDTRGERLTRDELHERR